MPPELLEAFGRNEDGVATETLSGEELQRALELLARHQDQVDEMIQHEQSAAVATRKASSRWATATASISSGLNNIAPL